MSKGKDLIRVYGSGGQNTVKIQLTSKAVEIIDEKHVVVVMTKAGIKIKRPTLESKRTNRISNRHIVRFSCNDAADYVGDYRLKTINSDEFLLESIDE